MTPERRQQIMADIFLKVYLLKQGLTLNPDSLKRGIPNEARNLGISLEDMEKFNIFCVIRILNKGLNHKIANKYWDEQTMGFSANDFFPRANKIAAMCMENILRQKGVTVHVEKLAKELPDVSRRSGVPLNEIKDLYKQIILEISETAFEEMRKVESAKSDS